MCTKRPLPGNVFLGSPPSGIIAFFKYLILFQFGLSFQLCYLLILYSPLELLQNIFSAQKLKPKLVLGEKEIIQIMEGKLIQTCGVQ